MLAFSNDYYGMIFRATQSVELFCAYDNFTELFVPKNVIVWIPVFKEFAKFGLDDIKFKDFVEEFEKSLYKKDVNGVTFDKLNEDRHTKGKAILKEKINILTALMKEYLHIKEDEESLVEVGENNVTNNVFAEQDTLEFIKENVKEDVIEDDIELYKSILKDWTKKIDKLSMLLEKENMDSLLAIVAYSIETELDNDMPEWMVSFFERNDTYIKDQKENYTYMVNDLSEFLRHKYELAG